MQQKKLILFLTALFILSSAYLLYTAKNYNDPDYQKNWWAVYFENPESDDLSFVIENHSDKNSFHYVVINGNDKVEEKDVLINKGEEKKLDFGNSLKSSFGENKKITVQVILGDEKKEIYKNL
ncbi:MAG TPA: hypothetical protein P5262_04865 [Candidatus Moranbacteria bacterium]|nr:hypothetical protein [Candidatus Moranbacteria bacterium]